MKDSAPIIMKVIHTTFQYDELVSNINISKSLQNCIPAAIANKSNIINQDFSLFMNESQDFGNKFFNRKYKINKNNEEVNVKEISS